MCLLRAVRVTQTACPHSSGRSCRPPFVGESKQEARHALLVLIAVCGRGKAKRLPNGLSPELHSPLGIPAHLRTLAAHMTPSYESLDLPMRGRVGEALPCTPHSNWLK